MGKHKTKNNEGSKRSRLARKGHKADPETTSKRIDKPAARLDVRTMLYNAACKSRSDHGRGLVAPGSLKARPN